MCKNTVEVKLMYIVYMQYTFYLEARTQNMSCILVKIIKFLRNDI